MSEPQDTSELFSATLDRFKAILNDDEFWIKRDAEIAEAEEKERRRQALASDARQKSRAEMIPPVYHEKFIRKKSAFTQETMNYIAEWSWKSDRGIGLIGSTGMGKTRILAAKLLSMRCSWLFLPAVNLGKAVGEQYDNDFRVAGEAVRLLKEAKSVRVLMIDDLGDENSTQAVSSEIKGLIEYRTSRGLPIFWTCNLTEDELKAQNKTRGSAILRRLTEFSWMD
jgi:DNA replication protein DnaC